uniref:NADH-ubiquinone oxidoreductase chain 6 n=1 Tax=Mordellochroa milleri TaxID=1588259 RepID=A0A343C1Q2_9CUCU|nr:NADH dehydrogenase subunit 6 [Mordellochroa milleri]
MFLMLLNMSLAITLIFLSHPLSMGLVLLCQTLIISLLMGNLSLTFWFSYILFIVMVGGMLVLFLYMTSIASNEKFSSNLWLIIPFSLLILTPLLKKSSIMLNINIKNEELISWDSKITMIQTMNKFMSWPSNMMIYFLIIYLLITLIAVVKLTTPFSGTFRPSN